MFTRLAVAFLFLLPLAAHAEPNSSSRRSHEDFTVAQLQAEMASGRLTSEALTREYIGRILAFDQDGPGVNSVMEVNPDALAWARHADQLRRQGRVLGPLHGIPVRVPLAGKTIAEAIAFNNANVEKEMPFFGQEIFELTAAMATGADDAQGEFGGMTYNQALEIDRLSGVNGIDKALDDFDLDAVMAPTDNPAWPTDLLYGDHFIFGSSGLAAGAG